MVRLGFGNDEECEGIWSGNGEECEGNEALYTMYLGFFSITLCTVYFMTKMAIRVQLLLVFFGVLSRY